MFIGRTDSEAETPILWPPHAKSSLTGKDSDAGRDWGQEEKGTTEDEMAGWYHRLNGRESEWTPGVGDGQEGLACCDSWGCKESDTTEQLNWIELNYIRNNLIYSWEQNFFFNNSIIHGKSTSTYFGLVKKLNWKQKKKQKTTLHFLGKEWSQYFLSIYILLSVATRFLSTQQFKWTPQ